MEMDDLLKMKMVGDNGGMSAYEQFKVGHMQSKRPSGVGIAGLAVGIGAGVAAIGVGIYANAKANSAKEVASAKYDGLRDIVTLTAQNLAAERAERITGDTTITQTVTDTLSGSQQGTLSATQQAELSQAQQLMFGLSTGEYSRNPQRVALYRDATPCPCPAGGCGCNG